MTTHSPLGASSAYRWFACPASVALCAKAVKRPATIFSATGAVAHFIAEQALIRNLDEEAVLKKYCDQEIVQDGFDILVDEDMISAVFVYVNYVRSQKQPNTEMYIEARVNIPITDSKWELYGTADCVLYNPFGCVEIVDYKNGSGQAVSAENNKQALFYALGALYTFGAEATEYRVTIVQPNCSLKNHEIETYTYSIEDLVRFEAELKEAVKQAHQTNAATVPGKHCRWCDANLDCHESKTVALGAVSLDLDEEVSTNSPRLKEMVCFVLDNKDRLQHLIDSATALAMDMCKRGEDLPYAVIEAEGREKWIDEDAAKAELNTLQENAYKPAQLKTPKQIRDTLKKLKIKLSTDHLSYRPTKYKLVPKANIKEMENTGLLNSVEI